MPSSSFSDKQIYRHAKNIADLYRLAGQEYADLPALASKQRGGEFRTRTFRELYEDGCALGTALIELGLQSRQHVALIADNREEWMICDCAIQLCGAADVPRAADVTPQEISYIVAHSDSVLVIVENPKVLQRVLDVRVLLPKVQQIILIEGEPPEGSGVLRLSDLLDRGRLLRAEGNREIESRMSDITGDDHFTLIYTSGTTGTPKGVVLKHSNMLSQVRDIPFDLTPTDRVLSILPVWHSYERVFEMVTISRGACTYYTSLRSVGDDLRKVQPTWMASAPRLWEGLYHRILQKVSSQTLLSRMMFRAAYHCSQKFQSARFFLTSRRLDLTGRSLFHSGSEAVMSLAVVAIYALPYTALDSLVLKKLRDVVGGNFCGTVSGGGALPPHVDEFFNYIGIPVLEGYGLTETSPVLAVRTWGKLVIGTVGPAWPHTEIRIVDVENGKILYPSKKLHRQGRGLKGEIHVKGPQVMKGYYKDIEGTERVMKDGWLNTGDLGMVTFNDCLKILGRSKETIVLLNGENVEPLPIEGQLLESRFIEQCLVVGQDEKQLGALVVPSLTELKVQGFDFSSLEEAVADERISDLIGKEVRRLVSREQGFKPFEHVACWRLLGKPFEVGDELTPTFKPKRHVITEKYASLIEDMFQHSRGTRRF